MAGALLTDSISPSARVFWSEPLGYLILGQTEELSEAIYAALEASETVPQARLVRIAHNLMLGVVTQSMAEITMLCEAAGVKRSDFLEFLNDSVMGSTFTRYKTPAFVNLDYTPTFTSHLLRKDLELGLDASRATNVPLPLTALTHQIVMENIGLGQGDDDFANLLSRQASVSGMEIESEGIDVPTGLE